MANHGSGLDVLFLDMDGVLLPFGGDVNVKMNRAERIFPDETLAALSLILGHVPSLRLVLSSTWRVQHDNRQEIIKSFLSYGKQHGGPLARIWDFYGVTNVKNHSVRQWEIYEWLCASQTNVRTWIALDDEELIEGEDNQRFRAKFEGHVVKTDSAVGLTDRDAQQAIALLKDQLKSTCSGKR